MLAGSMLVFAFRGARAGTVVTTDDSLVIRNVLSTHHVPYIEIQSVGAVTRRVGPMRYRRSCLVIERKDGRQQLYTEFNSAPSKPQHRARVEEVAEQLNLVVRQRAGANGQTRK